MTNRLTGVGANIHGSQLGTGRAATFGGGTMAAFLLAVSMVVLGCESSVPTVSPMPTARATAPEPAPSGSVPVTARPTTAPTPTSRPSTFTDSGQTDLPTPAGYTAALLKDGEVLVIGDGVALQLDPATGQFRSTGTPLNPPYLSIALADGRVLIFGGPGVQLYDLSTGQFSLTGSQPGADDVDTAVLLNDGRVLALTGPFAPRFAGTYDPATGKFSRIRSPKTVRRDETATLLPDGRVLIAGGSDWAVMVGGHFFASAELYDPVRGTWSPTGSMSTPRDSATATLLDSGQVLIAGGTNDNFEDLASAELYDPTTGRFTRTGSMSVARSGQTATRLLDGRVLIVGGNSDVQTAEIYDPLQGTFATVPTSGTLWPDSAFLLPDGRVLLLSLGSNMRTLSAYLYGP